MKNLQTYFKYAVCGVIDFIQNENEITNREVYVQYNAQVLSKFKKIVVAVNISPNLIKSYRNMWERNVSNVEIIVSKINRGPNFGAADLDNIIFDFVKYSTKSKWLVKISADVTINPDMNIEVEDGYDFYYINGFSFETTTKYTYDEMMNEYFLPQTNFYMIDVTKVDYLTDKKMLNRTYKEAKEYGYNIAKIWESIPNWSCEDFLKETVIRNGLKKYHILSNKSYNNLYSFIKSYKVGDPSHKNIMINGICHWHFPNQPTTIIS